MIQKLIATFVGFIFGLFAYFQWNDPDGWKWMLAYGLVAVLYLITLFDIYSLKASRLILITASCTAALYFPDIIDWFQKGMPSIVESMKAQSPHVEFVREFLGLIILIISLVLYPKLIPSDDD